MTNEEYIRILKVAIDNSREHISFCFDGIGIKALEMAIKALEQQPCEDCISRQDAIEYLCTNMNWYDEDGETADDEEKLNAITDLVNGVPSVTPSYNSIKTELEQTRWIPVSERLPEKTQEVLITAKYEFSYSEPQYEVLKSLYFADSEAHFEIDDENVIAWMPLPEPYKEVQKNAVNVIEQHSHLIDRPCEVCEFHTDNGCRRWKCVFEEGTK